MVSNEVLFVVSVSGGFGGLRSGASLSCHRARSCGFSVSEKSAKCRDNVAGYAGAYEVDTDGRDVGLGVCVVGESQEQAGLSNTGVTDEEELEEVVVSVTASV